MLLDRPIEQAVAAICRDLDLASVAALDESAVARLRAVVEWIVHRAEDAAGGMKPGTPMYGREFGTVAGATEGGARAAPTLWRDTS